MFSGKFNKVYFRFLKRYALFSSRRINLSIFFLCVNTSSTESSTEKNIREIIVVFPTKIIIIGKENPAIRELSDTYLVISNVIKNTIKETKAANGAIASATPNKEATPLPPFPRSQIE